MPVAFSPSLYSNSASEVGELTQCRRKRKCRDEDKHHRGLNSCPRFATELTKIINSVRYSKDCRNTPWRQNLTRASERITVLKTHGQVANHIAG
jgi:hypothetical protein